MYKHGHASRETRTTPEYNTWCDMKKRCHKSSHKDFPRYGGRGITVCERWRRSFAAFIADMGRRPPNTTIERINNDGNYEPGNVRWATETEQHRNRSDNVFVVVHGERLCLADAAKRYGLSTQRVWQRLQAGWTGDRLVQPPRGKPCSTFSSSS